jgi:hypothetical protein
MKTERRPDKEKSLKASLWGSLVGFVLLGTLVSAILRLYGAFQDQSLLRGYGVDIWKINWLLISPVILIIINLLGWLFLWQRWHGFKMLAWLSFVVNLLTYWAERLFVWSADQNLQGNLGFMIFVFGVYLALMVLFTLDLKAKDRN